GCSSLPDAVGDKRPHGNSGVSLRDVSDKTWVFETALDPMTGQAGYSAAIWSRNEVQLAPPYHGNQKLTLKVGRRAGGSSYAAIAIPRGQFSCYKCDIRIKFDENDAQLYSAD